MSRRISVAFVLAALTLPGFPSVRAQQGPQGGEWRAYAGDVQGMKYSPLDQITGDNIQDLQVAWRWPTADRSVQASSPLWRAGRYEDTPLMINGVLYTVTGLGFIAALDPATGATRWLYKDERYQEGKPPNGVGYAVRGLGYWTDGNAERLFHGTSDAYIVSIDAKTGKLDPAFGDGGQVDLMAGVRDAKRVVNFAGHPPFVAGNVVVAGNLIRSSALTKEFPPGDVKGFDARTGKLLWTFHVVPREGEFGYDTWLEDSAAYSGNANVWSGFSYDPELDYVYFPTSSATNDFYGGARPGANLFADSVVCLEAKTGKRVWHFQAIHHNLWDYEMGSAPILGEINIGGRRIKAVMQVSKQGFTYVFDRKTGEPVWPIEERPVPESTVPGEQSWPTQPFPVKPPAFTLQGATEANLIDFTPQLRQQAVERLRQFEHGPLYTPPSLKGTLTVPGIFGGANWGGSAFDPDSGVLYVPSIMGPSVFRLAPGNPEQTNLLYRPGGVGLRIDAAMIDGLSIFKPPYSHVAALDMNKGEQLWMKPIGNGPRNHPLLKGLDLPPLGDGLYTASVLVTKTLLLVSATHLNVRGNPQPPAWAEWGDPDADRKLIYVFDKASGDVLRILDMDGQASGAPMTYQHGGKQYIVVAVGAGENSELVAFALSTSSKR